MECSAVIKEDDIDYRAILIVRKRYLQYIGYRSTVYYDTISIDYLWVLGLQVIFKLHVFLYCLYFFILIIIANAYGRFPVWWVPCQVFHLNQLTGFLPVGIIIIFLLQIRQHN